MNLEAFTTSTALVALGEMGDKTQLLALLLAARYRKPWPIVWGILIATLANHALAGALGAWLTRAVLPWLGEGGLRWALALAFFAMAAWVLVPDTLDEDEVQVAPRWGVLLTTVWAFFLAEMGDKTQIATVALAARYEGALLAVVAGTTLGMMLANVPVVWLGGRVGTRLPLTWVRRVAAAVFAALGVATLLA